MNPPHNKQIWRGLVAYANEETLEANAEALRSFAQTLWSSMPWMSRTAFGQNNHDVPEMIAQQVRPDLSANVERPVTNAKSPAWVFFKTEEQLEDEFRRQAVQYQPQLRQLLKWLSDPKQKNRSHAFSFLYEHTQHIEFQRGDPAYVPEEDDFRYFTFQGEPKDDFPHRTRVYKDLADVICDFVQTEHEAQRPAPIRICKRPGCGNLVAQLKKRQYCRSASCDRERQKRDDDVQQKRNRDNVFVCRLRKLPLAMRRKKVRESAGRLREIESYWKDRNQSLAEHAARLLAEGQKIPGK